MIDLFTFLGSIGKISCTLQSHAICGAFEIAPKDNKEKFGEEFFYVLHVCCASEFKENLEAEVKLYERNIYILLEKPIQVLERRCEHKGLFSLVSAEKLFDRLSRLLLSSHQRIWRTIWNFK
ncbi:hypothetical protein NPIL_328831 [Nephila pilipes]|uniref:Uncharacterized protein n=1 Tax=Nephila pilipes TaxID=299642 RepID=A0A8X6PI66_NEPPI|nr:hypothetical protein NPIL_72441 [Nephila pilipes]GFU02003.1 hypothetical protein NPIL_328831 [Nephila pilipes]